MPCDSLWPDGNLRTDSAIVRETGQFQTGWICLADGESRRGDTGASYCECQRNLKRRQCICGARPAEEDAGEGGRGSPSHRQRLESRFKEIWLEAVV